MMVLEILQEHPVYTALALMGMFILYYFVFGRKTEELVKLEQEYQEVLTLDQYRVKGQFE